MEQHNNENRGPAPAPILHHYEASPYAEKIRLMFGQAGMQWQSLLSPVQPPRPNVDPLVGGYRRIPVMQIGADIYCDTALIARVISELGDVPSLAPASTQSDSTALAARAEGDVFFSAITSVSPLRTLLTMLGGFGVMGTVRFVRDRGSMMKGATVKTPDPARARTLMQEFQQDLDRALGSARFLGGDAPVYADFCCYHPLWLNAFVSKQPIGKGYPNIQRWVDALVAIGHGSRQEIDQAAAFKQARESEPVSQAYSLEHPLLGKAVSIAPTDYGIQAVSGELVHVAGDRCTVARDTSDFGRVHVHFPMAGYNIQPR